MAKPLVIVFARSPRYGAIKSRLAKDLGAAETLRFYKTTLASLLRTIGRDPRWETVVAVTPDIAVTKRAIPWRRIVAQGSGHLGVRMIRALRGAGSHRPAIIIGSDIPDITTGRIAAAFRALGRAPIVLGPAADGGYWLIGARHPERLPLHTLDGVRWSTKHARADTIARLGAGNLAVLPFELEDIDDADAYRRWRARTKRRL
jgi:rSAM/selenodomain-associated transferase 1